MPALRTWLKYLKHKVAGQNNQKEELSSQFDSPYDIFQGLKNKSLKDDRGSTDWKDSDYENTGFIEKKNEVKKWTNFELAAILIELLLVVYILLFFLGWVPLF